MKNKGRRFSAALNHTLTNAGRTNGGLTYFFVLLVAGRGR